MFTCKLLCFVGDGTGKISILKVCIVTGYVTNDIYCKHNILFSFKFVFPFLMKVK